LSKIGFIGLGAMGQPMARHLVEAGHELVVYDRSSDACAAFSGDAHIAEDVAGVAQEAQIVFLSLPEPTVVLAVGRDIAANSGQVKHVVDLSTTGSNAERALAQILASKRITLIDSPVSGGVAGAKAATLAIMVAGSEADLTLVNPLLARLGKVIPVAAEPGQAQTMKLVNNICSAAALAITSEAMAMGAKGGLDPQVMVEVLNAGSGRSSASADKIPRFVLPRGFDFGFPLALSLKDIRLCLEEAEHFGTPMLVGQAVRMLYSIARTEFGDSADMTEIARLCERWAGVELNNSSTPANGAS